ncbi:MAG: ribonuclease III [Gammaproteobacteria bacterium]|nr:ribonuclease III [Gammaproteobacteria bacterium]MBQ0839780.1 ribonuclease III [Gammaproteobacteria bacterium]
MNISRRRFVNRLGHSFTDPALLEQALTHRSYSATNNERLEFLGDAVLDMVVSEMLYRHFPAASEGDLSRLRAVLVKGEALAKMARAIDIGDQLRLGSGELKSGGFRRDSILAGAYEALIGAILLDGGFATCRACVASWFEPLLQNLSLGDEHKDAKSRLQEYLQGKGEPLPVYKLLTVSGEGHAQHFEVQCCINGVSAAYCGAASSRRKAEQVAATVALNNRQKQDNKVDKGR